MTMIGDTYIHTGELPPPAAWDQHDGLSMTGVILAFEGPESDAETTADVPRVPAWALACVFFGALLMALGFGAARPVAELIYSIIH